LKEQTAMMRSALDGELEDIISQAQEKIQGSELADKNALVVLCPLSV
jgi:hypothetical protein